MSFSDAQMAKDQASSLLSLYTLRDREVELEAQAEFAGGKDPTSPKVSLAKGRTSLLYLLTLSTLLESRRLRFSRLIKHPWAEIWFIIARKTTEISYERVDSLCTTRRESASALARRTSAGFSFVILLMQVVIIIGVHRRTQRQLIGKSI